MKHTLLSPRFLALCLLACLGLLSVNAIACVTMESPNNGEKSHPFIKHFSQSYDKVRQIILHNEDAEQTCQINISTVELIQKLDGGYQFLDAIPGFAMDRSLLPYMDLRDHRGQSVINTQIAVAPKTMVALNYTFNFPQDKQSGSYHGGIKLSFPQYGSFISTVETYFTFDAASENIDVLKLDYDTRNKRMDYTIQNKGDAYTFFRFEVTLVDPVTGLERSYFQSDSGKVRRFLGNIRNFPLPKDQASAKLSASFGMRNFFELYLDEYKKQFPNEAAPDVLIAVITPAFGIDHANWKNHNFRYLKRKTFTISNPFN